MQRLNLKEDCVRYCLAEVRRGIYGDNGIYFAIVEDAVEAYQYLPLDDPRQSVMDQYLCMLDIIFDQALRFLNDQGRAALRRLKVIELGRKALAAARSAHQLGLVEVEVSAMDTLDYVLRHHHREGESKEPITLDDLSTTSDEYQRYRKPLVIIRDVLVSGDVLWQQYLDHLSNPNRAIEAASTN